MFFGTLAWFASRYLAAYQLGYIDTMWDPFFGNGTIDVITSKISKDFPVSDAGLGAFSYTLDVLLAAQGDKRRWHTMPWMVLLFGVVVVPGSLVSIVLIILQPLVIGSWCFLCLFTAACMLMMVIFAVDEVAATLQFLQLKKKEGKSVWQVFCHGDTCIEATKDETTPLVDSSFSILYRAATWGVGIRWKFLFSAILGVLVIAAPSFFEVAKIVADSDFITGALIVVVSVLSMAEVMHKSSYLNFLFALWIVILPFWVQEPWLSGIYHFLIGLFLFISTVL
jgi:hypothetical protein